MPGPHPPEFRRRAVELARELDEDGTRKHPIARLARDLSLDPPAGFWKGRVGGLRSR